MILETRMASAIKTARRVYTILEDQIIDNSDWLDKYIVTPLRLRPFKEIQSQSRILGVKHKSYNELFG